MTLNVHHIVRYCASTISQRVPSGAITVVGRSATHVSPTAAIEGFAFVGVLFKWIESAVYRKEDLNA